MKTEFEGKQKSHIEPVKRLLLKIILSLKNFSKIVIDKF